MKEILLEMNDVKPLHFNYDTKKLISNITLKFHIRNHLKNEGHIKNNPFKFYNKKLKRPKNQKLLIFRKRPLKSGEI